MAEKPKKHLKERSGIVVSDKMEKTIVVRVDRRSRHPRFGKIIRLSKKYYAHDEENKAHIGDLVRIVESRPLSRLKRWTLVEVVARGEGVQVIGREEEVKA